MKKKVFRERYNEMNAITREKAIELIDKGMEIIDNKKKITKRGKKSVKSNK